MPSSGYTAKTQHDLEILIIMDPPGVFIVFGILHFYTDTDTDIVTGTVGTLLHRPGLDPGTSK